MGCFADRFSSMTRFVVVFVSSRIRERTLSFLGIKHVNANRH